MAADLERYGLTPHVVRQHLADGGDKLWAAAQGAASAGWADPVDGPLTVTLLAREVMEYAAHLSARAAEVRRIGVNELLQEYSVVTVAGALRVSRQTVYSMAAGRSLLEYVTTAWKAPS